MTSFKAQIIKEELNKLLAANFVRDVRHPSWLANVVVVLKSILVAIATFS